MNCSIETFQIEIPIGLLEIDYCLNGLHKTELKRIDLKSNPLKIHLINPKQIESKTTNECFKYFENYFTIRKKNELKPSICWSSICKANTFKERVLKELYQSKIGDQLSYRELSQLAGSLNAQRAVGTIMKQNPIIIIIPCHRVIKSNKEIGNYNSGGADVKQWLLDHEISF